MKYLFLWQCDIEQGKAFWQIIRLFFFVKTRAPILCKWCRKEGHKAADFFSRAEESSLAPFAKGQGWIIEGY